MRNWIEAMTLPEIQPAHREAVAQAVHEMGWGDDDPDVTHWMPLPIPPITTDPATVALRLTWTGGERPQIDYVTVPAEPEPEVGRVEFGGGVACLVEVV